MLQPGDIVTINGRATQLRDNCELPRDENYDSGRFGVDGLRVDAYNPALYVNKSPVLKHARDANGREYLSEEIWRKLELIRSRGELQVGRQATAFMRRS